jgi:hypothetical protein
VAVFKSMFWDENLARLRAGWRLIVQFILLVACLACFGLLANRFGDYVPRDPLDKSISLLDSAAALLSIILSVWVAGRFVDRRRFSDFGFRLGRSWWIDLAFGLALGAFGPEAGIFGMLARLAGILLVLAWVWLRYGKIGPREELTAPDLLRSK